MLDIQRSTMQIKINRLEDVVRLENQCDQHPASLHQAAKDMTRRLIVHEVNEAILTKKLGLLTEELKVRHRDGMIIRR